MRHQEYMHQISPSKKSLSNSYAKLLAECNLGAEDQERFSAFAKTINMYEDRYNFKIQRANTDKKIAIKVLDQTIEGLHERSRELEQQEASLAATVQQLKRANDDMQHFMHVASHDLKTPLRSIGSFSSLITRRLGDKIDEDVNEYFGFITRSAQAMNRVIDDLVRFNSAANDGYLEEVDVAEVAAEVVHNLHADIVESGADLNIGKLGVILAARSSVSQLLQNLIRNAIVYRDSARTPIITIGCEEFEGVRVLAIKDNGIGLDNAYWEKAFLPFKRVGDVTKPGTGMGLAICRRIARKTGGDIWYDGKVGVGTTFYVSFTATPRRAQQGATRDSLVTEGRPNPSC